MSAVWITLALCFYALIFKYGHLLHHIDTFAALQQINSENFHHLQLNPNNLPESLNLYSKNLWRSNSSAAMLLNMRYQLIIFL